MGLDSYLFLKGKQSQEMCYWRKANEIHRFFTEKALDCNEDNCVEIPCNLDDLEELEEYCKIILNASKNNSEIVYEDAHWNCWQDFAMDYLPRTSGFFFGSTEYDEWYLHDLEKTLDMFNDMKNQGHWNEENDFYYYAWY